MLKKPKNYLRKIYFNYYIYHFHEVKDSVRKLIMLENTGLQKPFAQFNKATDLNVLEEHKVYGVVFWLCERSQMSNEELNCQIITET